MRLLLLLALAALLEAPARAATLGELEQEAVRRAAERDAARSERQRLAAEAAPLADAVARSDDQGPSAGRQLTGRLRALDRLATRLDEVERRMREAELRLERATTAFEKQALLEERALLERGRTGDAASVASELAALADARRRIAGFSGRPRFRRPLVVSVADSDGPAEIEAKLSIIDGERARLTERERELREEESLLAARVRARREWARDLGAGRREAAGEIELLERAHESAEGVLRGLSERAAAVAAERAQLRQWDAVLARCRLEAEERLRSLEPRRATP